MDSFKIIAFTHKNISIDEIGKFHIADDIISARLNEIKSKLKIDELMYLSTCNRVEFLIVTDQILDRQFLQKFISVFQPSWTPDLLNHIATSASVFENEIALEHLFKVASSLDSLVVGEREIITQVRNAYEKCKEFDVTGDLLRLVVKRTIETAKKVYTETAIARNPVSVVSLAYRKLKELNVKLDTRFLIIGSGVTNTTMTKYLKKHGFTNFVVFNRTLANAQKLAAEVGAKAFALTELSNYTNGFDVILTCTGAAQSIITKDIYTKLMGNDTSRKIVIDLAIPNDLDEEVMNSFDINLIAVNNLQDIAKENLSQRESELDNCSQIISESINEFRHILKTRRVELAMSQVPRKVKEIRETAINEVFAKDIEGLDMQSKEVLDKVISYLEKKYISVPMKMAKEILMEELRIKN